MLEVSLGAVLAKASNERYQMQLLDVSILDDAGQPQLHVVGSFRNADAA